MADEQKRLKTLLEIETHIRQLGYNTIAGVDEAGRGPLAGPVVAAACIIPEGVMIEGINDSKQLPSCVREALFVHIVSLKTITYGIGIADARKIDEINILRATLEAMKEAISFLQPKPDYLLVDGLHLPTQDIPGLPIVKGDAKSQAIAAASVLAKVTRDRLMLQYHEHWPEYGFDRHKGYGTSQHLEAIEKFGPCPIHRRSFDPFKSLAASKQLELF